MAQDEEAIFGVEFLVGAGGEFTHGNEQAGLDMGRGVLPVFAYIDELGFAFGEQCRGVLGCYFIVIHAYTIRRRRRGCQSDLAGWGEFR